MCALLEELGWSLDRQRKERVFVKTGEFPIVVGVVSGRKVKRVYLDMIYERLGLDD